MSIRNLVVAGAVLASTSTLAAITGNVFQDFNSNGIKDTTTTLFNSGVGVGAIGGTGLNTVGVANDRGLAKVVVTAYCVTSLGADGVAGTSDDIITAFAAAAPTDASGDYAITTTGVVAVTSPAKSCRVEFTWDSASLLDGSAPNPLYGMNPSFVGGGSNTATQFVNDAATNVNLGLNYPADFCQNNPTLATTCFTFGDAASGRTHLYSFPYSGNTPAGAASTNPAPTAVVTNTAIGSSWGIAYHKPSKLLATAAYLKRHTAIGPGGLGQIYTVSTAGVTNNLINLGAAAAGANPRVTSPIDYDEDGDLLSTTEGILVGKRGIGDIDFSDDMTKLYAVGLASRKLYIVPVNATLTGTTGTTAEVTLPVPTECAAGDVRPFALKFSKGSIYVGMTCTAESTVTVALPNGDTTKLRAYVYRLTAAGGSPVQVANFVLTGGPGWGVWNVFEDNPSCCTNNPQPLVSDIEFDGAGNMILGVRDRFGDITGRGTQSIASTGTQSLDGRANGDTIRACLSGATYSPANCATNGIGFYNDQPTFVSPAFATDGNGSHGGLVQVPGFPDVVTTIKDPAQIYSGGVGWMSNTDGAYTKGYEILPPGAQIGSVYINGSKAAALGDIEALCDSAPLEVGNRIWKDTNGNGIQDPGEPPLAGVTVRLYAPDGSTVLGTAITDADGQYAFSNRTTNADGTPTVSTSSVINGIAALTADTSGFSIRIDNASDYAAGGPLAALLLTKADAGGVVDNNALTDLTDSDAKLPTPASPIGTGNYPAITFNTGGPGENNFGLDVGFTPSFSLGNRVWFDANNNGLVDGSETGVDGVVVELLVETAPGSGLFVPTATPTTLTTANGGYYRFDGLLAGNYKVRVNASNFAAAGPLRGYFTSGTPVADVNGDVNNDNNGIAPTGTGTNTYVQAGVSSGPVTLGGATQEPTNDNTEASGTAAYNATNSNGTAAADAQSNLSVDFGFHKVSIGNRLWLDNGGGTPANADNGIADAGEPPVADGTVVNLVDAAGNVIATTTTTGGLYAFTTDTAGNPLLLSGSPADIAKQFRVVVPTPPTGTVSSTPTETVLTPTGNDKDHGAPGTGTAVQTNLFTLTPGATTGGQTVSATGVTDQPQLDMGFAPAPTYSLGNRVWFDANNNGLVDGAEAGVDGVLVELLAETTPGSGVYAATGTTLTTANGGFYRFDGLVPGNYKVRVNPSNFAAAGPLRGYFTSGTPTANANDDANNDNNGIAPTGGDYVGQGVSSGAVTVGGATPEPTNDNTEASATASYNATNSNGTAAPDARSNLSVDFGFHAVSIGNRVWLDTGTGAGQTNNGVFDAGEAPVADGTAVTLVDALGNVIATTTTVGGTYLFSTDTAGNPLLLSGSPADVAKQFRVVISPPAGLASSTPTSPVAAGNDEKDHGTPTAAGGNIQSPNFSFSNLGTTTNGQVPTAATAVTTQPQLDFGLVPTFSLGNRVWFDGNNNGLVDGAETGVDGVVVELLVETTPGSGVFVPTATPTTLTTANGGYYRFDGLGAGNYKVRVAASNFAATGPLRGYFTSGTPVANANGDANNDNNGIAPAGTGTDTYVQAGVSSGPITLGGATPEPTNDNTEASGAATYNATNSNGTAAPDAQSNLSVDFGFHKVVIGNQLWFDTGTGAGQTNNGVFDAGESPLPDGTVVNLVDAAGNIIATTTTTGGTGTYVFMTDTAGNPLLNSTADAATKQFRVVVPTPPAGAVSSTPTETTLTATGDGKDHGAPGAAGAVQTGLFNLTPGAASNGQTVSPATAVTRQLQLDMGFVPLYSLGNRVWLDTDNSGTINNGEQGKDGVVVNLLNGTGQALYRQTDGSLGTTVTATPITTTTAGGGYYRFDGLPPGQYTVQLAPVNFAPGGMLYSASTSAPLPVSTGPGANGNDGVDNNSNAIANPNPAANGIRSNVVTLGDGTGEPTGETDLSATGQGSSDNRADMTIDFGFVPVTFALGNAVFVDANNNGIKDPGEVGIGAGVTVELFADANGDGIPDGPAIKTTTTNGDGQYLFSGLPEGQYIVQISGAPLTGYASSTGINGSATGPYEPGSGDFTATGNDRDHGRTVSPGVIRSGTITLGANTPTGEGTDLTVTDPNATPDSRTNLTVDFGVFRPASIGTVVWIDNGSNGGVSGDGIKQPGEVGIPGVTVRLLDASGNPVDGDPATPGVQPVTTVTDANGAYSFTNLIPGQYQVEFVFPPGSTVTNTVNPPGSGSPAVGLDSQRNEMNPGTRRTPVITLTAGQDNPNLDSGVLAFSNVPKEIPTLNEWMLMLLSLLMIGVIALRVRPTRRG
jgi:hypothetical protein